MSKVQRAVTDAFGNALGDSLARANSSASAVIGADERARILGYFADGPGTGSNAALDYIANNKWSGMSDTSVPATRSHYDDTFGLGSIQVGGPSSLGAAGNSTWAEKYKPLLDQYREKNPVEVDLFSNMLQTIPSYVVSNESTWASVVAGFDTYARQQAVPAIGAAVANFENDTLGLRRVDPRNWLDWLTVPGDVRSAGSLPNSYVEAVKIIRTGPQVFNQAWYEGVWGTPPHPWSNYAPGWAPTKPEAK